MRSPLTAFDLRPSSPDQSRPHGASRLPAEGEPTEETPASRPAPIRVSRGISALLVALCLVGSLQVLGLTAVEVRRIVYAEGEIARLERELAEIERETADLRAVAERGEDERYRELLARRQGYLYPHETRYVGAPLP